MTARNTKTERQNAIGAILNSGSGSSQEEIKAYLASKGIDASQATLSRDLREMGAVKIPLESGRSVYRLQSSQAVNHRIAMYEVAYETVGHLLVIKTATGHAPGLCAIIDQLGLPEIAGTVAGDDTILAVLRDETSSPQVITQLEQAAALAERI